MLFAVGTTNQAKLAAVEGVIAKLFEAENKSLEIKGVTVSSGVGDQPISAEETMLGAQNRAKAALAAVPTADFGIGLEGGLEKIGDLYFECGWMAVVDRQGKLGLGRYKLPFVAALLDLGCSVRHDFKSATKSCECFSMRKKSWRP